MLSHTTGREDLNETFIVPVESYLRLVLAPKNMLGKVKDAGMKFLLAFPSLSALRCSCMAFELT